MNDDIVWHSYQFVFEASTRVDNPIIIKRQGYDAENNILCDRLLSRVHTVATQKV